MSFVPFVFRGEEINTEEKLGKALETIDGSRTSVRTKKKVRAKLIGAARVAQGLSYQPKSKEIERQLNHDI